MTIHSGVQNAGLDKNNLCPQMPYPKSKVVRIASRLCEELAEDSLDHLRGPKRSRRGSEISRLLLLQYVRGGLERCESAQQLENGEIRLVDSEYDRGATARFPKAAFRRVYMNKAEDKNASSWNRYITKLVIHDEYNSKG